MYYNKLFNIINIVISLTIKIDSNEFDKSNSYLGNFYYKKIDDFVIIKIEKIIYNE